MISERSKRHFLPLVFIPKKKTENSLWEFYLFLAGVPRAVLDQPPCLFNGLHVNEEPCGKRQPWKWNWVTLWANSLSHKQLFYDNSAFIHSSYFWSCKTDLWLNVNYQVCFVWCWHVSSAQREYAKLLGFWNNYGIYGIFVAGVGRGWNRQYY